MQTVLSWVNPNAISVITKIYRSAAEINRANPGTPLVTLSAGETSWVDDTAVAGINYYYLVVVISAANPNDFIVSRNYRTSSARARGPGPQTLQYGDTKLGYFGTVTSSEILTRQELIAKYSTLGAPVVVNPTHTLWHKFVRNNKILYVPESLIATNVTWSALYSAGLVFGYDGDGKGNPADLPGTKVNQLRTVTSGKNVFIVRLPTGFDDTHAAVPGTALVGEFASPYSNEWEDIYAPLCLPVPPTQKFPNLTRYTGSDLGLYGRYYNSNTNYKYTHGAMCQELVSGDRFVSRGGTQTNTYVERDTMALYKTPLRTPVFSFSLYSADPVFCTGWWPVLELVE